MDDGRPSEQRPGPVYDQAMRRLVAADPVGFCRLVGVAVDPANGPPAFLGTRFPSGDVDADLLVRLGPQRLLHVEYQLRAERGLAVRMLRYRAAAMAAYPDDVLTQVVVVLRNGTLDSVDEVGASGFRLGCRPVYLREIPPETLLRTPYTAPLAVLGRGTSSARAAALGRAFAVIREGSVDRATELVDVAAMLATVRLDAATIEKIGREAGMTLDGIADFYAETGFGQLLEQRGVAKGLEQGLERGLEQGRVEALAAVVVERFGDRPEVADVARRLAEGPDLGRAIHAVLTAASFEELLRVVA